MKKLIKGLVLAPLSVVLVVLVVMIIVVVSINQTLFNSEKFEQIVIEERLGQKAYDATLELVQNADEVVSVTYEGESNTLSEGDQAYDDFIQSMKAQALESLDETYFIKALPAVVIDLHRYYVDGNQALPVINISPLKGLVLELIHQDILFSLPQASYQDLEEVKLTTKAVGHRFASPDDLVKHLTKAHAQTFKDLDPEFMTNLIDQMRAHPDEDLKGLIRQVVETTVLERVGYEKIATHFNLETYYFRIYGSDVNPVSELPFVMQKIKTALLITLWVTAIILVLIVYLVCGRVQGFTRLLGILGVIGGGLIFVPSGLMLLFNVGFSEMMVADLFGQGMAQELPGMTLFIGVMIKVAVKQMTLVAGGVLLLGMALVVASIYDHQLSDQDRSSATLYVRMAFALICVVIIPAHMAYQANQINRVIKNYDYMVDRMQVSDTVKDQIFHDMLGTQDLFDLMDNPIDLGPEEDD